MQILLTEQEYADLKELADKAENCENLYNELMLRHLALKNKYTKLLIFGVSSDDEKLKTHVYQYTTNQRGHGKC